MKNKSILFALAAALSLPAGFALAADATPVKERVKTQKKEQEQIYGRQLMTQQERAEQRAKMRAAKTVEEREQIRKEHHDRMQERAKERGVTLPNEPPARGGRMGPGGGMGPGSGMGPGGRNR